MTPPWCKLTMLTKWSSAWCAMTLWAITVTLWCYCGCCVEVRAVCTRDDGTFLTADVSPTLRHRDILSAMSPWIVRAGTALCMRATLHRGSLRTPEVHTHSYTCWSQSGAATAIISCSNKQWDLRTCTPEWGREHVHQDDPIIKSLMKSAPQ